MASYSLIIIAFLGFLGGLAYFQSKLKKISGTVIVIVIGLVSLYISVLLSDLILSHLGFETGFPSLNTGYYLYQSFIYIGIGLLALGGERFLLRDGQTKELGLAFWWTGIILLISGGLDLLVEAFIRLEMLELRLFFALIVLIGLVMIASKYRNVFFGSSSEGEKEKNTRSEFKKIV